MNDSRKELTDIAKKFLSLKSIKDDIYEFLLDNGLYLTLEIANKRWHSDEEIMAFIEENFESEEDIFDFINFIKTSLMENIPPETIDVMADKVVESLEEMGY